MTKEEEELRRQSNYPELWDELVKEAERLDDLRCATRFAWLPIQMASYASYCEWEVQFDKDTDHQG